MTTPPSGIPWRRLLYADDDASTRQLIQAVLASEGFELIEAVDGNDAWEKLHRYNPQVAIFDVKMPGRTGLELARAIRENPEGPQPKVILLTAGTSLFDMASSSEEDGYLW